MNNICPLCSCTGFIFHDTKNRLYHKCPNCYGIFMDKEFILDKDKEKERYELHNNNIEDKGYQNFVSPITSAIMHDFTQEHQGLDFGAGTGPVISKILNDNGFVIKQYDPFFHTYPELLKGKYHYIACCEVMEHFHNPNIEFRLLRNLLHPNGKIYCYTHIYDASIIFHNWYYINDPTHVFIYQKETIAWIKQEFDYSDATIDGKLITFSV